VKLGFMSFFVKAAVHALRKYPVVNASIDGTDIVYHGYYDIGIAVGSERGLVVPILRNADQMSIAQIEKQIADFGKRAKDGKITLEELTGGTFSISNGGVFGSMLSTPIINPAAERDPRRARHQGARGGGERPGRGAADELPGAFLRPPHHRRPRGGAVAGGDEGSARGSGTLAAGHLRPMPRRKRLRLAALGRRAFFFVAGSLLTGFLAIFLDAVLALYLPRHFAVSLAVGLAVAATLWLLRLVKHAPLLLRHVPPIAAGLCAGLGVHIARLWINRGKNAMAQTFDVVVIGAGPGGYIAAVRAAQLGTQDSLHRGLEEPKGELALGGTCLNVGCIPSKALLASSEEFEKASHHLMPTASPSPGEDGRGEDAGAQGAIVTKMTKGVEYLFKKNKITWLQGMGRFVSRRDSTPWRPGKETGHGEARDRRHRLEGAAPAGHPGGQRHGLRQRGRARLPRCRSASASSAPA
jgi:hypothetical protein